MKEICRANLLGCPARVRTPEHLGRHNQGAQRRLWGLPKKGVAGRKNTTLREKKDNETGRKNRMRLKPHTRKMRDIRLRQSRSAPRIVEDSDPAPRAYREIKRRILELKYAPGERLSELRLAAELGLGRSPIRTAFAQLRGEGWVSVSPQSGTYVRGLTEEEIAEVFEVRLVLETYVAGMAASRISLEKVNELRTAFRSLIPFTQDEDLERYLELDLQLHVTIYHAAGNNIITSTLLNLLDRIAWIRRGSTSWPWRIEEAIDEGQKILAALDRRDAAAASKAMHKHITNSRNFRSKRDAMQVSP
jgi:DNA-binding GntR family transcriptional regulator